MLLNLYIPRMLNPAKSFTDLVVWQKAHEFVLRLLPLHGTLPTRRNFCSDFPNAPYSGICACKHFRRLRQANNGWKAFSTLLRARLKRVSIIWS